MAVARAPGAHRAATPSTFPNLPVSTPKGVRRHRHGHQYGHTGGELAVYQLRNIRIRKINKLNQIKHENDVARYQLNNEVRMTVSPIGSREASGWWLWATRPRLDSTFSVQEEKDKRKTVVSSAGGNLFEYRHPTC